MGMFGRNTGNTLANILGTVGDALMMREGMGPVYTPLRMQRREDEEKRRAEEERRMQLRAALQGIGKTPQEIDAIEAGAGDYLPKPINNDTVNDYNFIKERLGDEAANDYLRRKGDPFINMTLPGNNFYSGPASGVAGALGRMGGGGQGGSDPDNTPTVEDGFQYTPGPGGRRNQSNWKPVGGGTGNGAGGFQGR